MAESETDAPERVWISYPVEFKSLISKGGPAFDSDIQYVRADAPNTRQRAERAATKIIESRLDLGLCKLLDGTITDEMRFSKLTDIIAAEFEK